MLLSIVIVFVLNNLLLIVPFLWLFFVVVRVWIPVELHNCCYGFFFLLSLSLSLPILYDIFLCAHF